MEEYVSILVLMDVPLQQKEKKGGK